MTEPIYGQTTERWYGDLPDVFGEYDINQAWQLKTWISGIGDIESDLDDLVDRFIYTPPEEGVPVDTSDLTDPVTADAEWLPWLAQFVGLVLTQGMTTQDRRDAISGALTGPRPGTKAFMARAAQAALTGDKYIAIFDHTTNSAAIGAAGEWDMLIVTKATETLSDPVAAVIAAGAKPAGVDLNAETFTSSWDDIEANIGPWSVWDASSWNTIEEAGL